MTSPSDSPIQKLPIELIFKIMAHAGPVSSTCLGLTCKKFYPIHRDTYGKVDLVEEGWAWEMIWSDTGVKYPDPPPSNLATRLETWARTAGLIWDERLCKGGFIPRHKMVWRKLKSWLRNLWPRKWGETLEMRTRRLIEDITGLKEGVVRAPPRIQRPESLWAFRSG